MNFIMPRGVGNLIQAIKSNIINLQKLFHGHHNLVGKEMERRLPGSRLVCVFQVRFNEPYYLLQITTYEILRHTLPR